ncbi:SAM-dependent methyltransferase [Streptomyces aureoverticillatus]|uniref:SAM-dependent methyltransferase n=1 Tax=Streptomyces aureoverticillatus TaxID=66871 RepID=UPI0013DB699D|nr:SAM-dependent methyltransferase [Streptomyces aureoverticillatus]QIB44303.1 SAM-dependent methyltransferase [Streptomyces aureoverticillatus]
MSEPIADHAEPSAAAADGEVSSARFWNACQGGKDNYERDRQAVEAVEAIAPGISADARSARQFLRRTVRWAAAEAGVTQYLDLGAGLPLEPDIHHIVSRHQPDARVLYVDNDPVVLAHQGAYQDPPLSSYIDADMRDTDTVMAHVTESFDLAEPVMLTFSSVLGHFSDEEAHAFIGRLLDRLAPGSCLMLSHDIPTPAIIKACEVYSAAPGALPYQPRTIEQLLRFFDGMDIVEPGLVPLFEWRPDDATEMTEIMGYGAVGRLR